MHSTQHTQSGFHLVPVIAIVGVVALLGAIGFLFWSNFGKQAVSDAALDVATKQARDECEKEADKDICRFLTSWKVYQKYRMTSISSDGSKFVTAVDGDKSHVKTEGEMVYEVITIGKVTYTKGGDKWYKSTIKTPKDNVADSYKPEIGDSTGESSDVDEQKTTTTYKLIGKEACGSLTCFKYDVVDSASEDKQTIWFDDKDYKLRKQVHETTDGKTEMTLEYDKVSITTPSPVVELAENQYLLPGATEPTTLPAGLGQ